MSSAHKAARKCDIGAGRCPAAGRRTPLMYEITVAQSGRGGRAQSIVRQRSPHWDRRFGPKLEKFCFFRSEKTASWRNKWKAERTSALCESQLRHQHGLTG